MTLLEARSEYGISQIEAASFLGVPLRTYIRYEKDDSYGNSLKREMMLLSLIKQYEITETHGLLTIDKIKESLTKLFDSQYSGDIEFCYLFGSYAKGYAKETSDVDLCVATSLTGFKFVGLSESIRTTLHKNIDLIRFNNLNDNMELLNEIMKNGIKIYG